MDSQLSEWNSQLSDTNSATVVDDKRRAVRFSAGEDILVLKEVLAENPFAITARWNTIADRMRTNSPKAFTARNVRERVLHILKLFIKGEREILKKSGTEEECTERENLLEEVKAIKESTPLIPKGKRARAESLREEGRRLRLEAAASLSQRHHEEEVECSSVHCETVMQSDECIIEFPECNNNCLTAADAAAVLSVTTSPSSLVSSSGIAATQNPPLTAPAPVTAAAKPVPHTLAINSTTPKSSNFRNKAAFNKAVMEHMQRKRESDSSIQLKNLDLELLKAANEKKRLDLEESKQLIFVENQSKLLELVIENEKQISALDEKLDSIAGNQQHIIELLSNVLPEEAKK